MKKGKRQIVQKNPFEEETNTNHQQYSQTHSTFDSNFTSQPISKPTRPHEDPLVTKTLSNYGGQRSSFSNQNQVTNQNQQESAQITNIRTKESINAIPVSKTKKADIPVLAATEQQAQVRQHQKVEKEPSDDKKSRIQMLKQKYLKKGTQPKPSTAQNQEKVAEKQPIQIKQQQPIAKTPQPKVQLPKQPVSVLNRQLQSKKASFPTKLKQQISQNGQKHKPNQQTFQPNTQLNNYDPDQDIKPKDQIQAKAPVQPKRQQKKPRVPPPPPNYPKNQAPSYPKQQKTPPPPRQQTYKPSQPVQPEQQVEPEEKEIVHSPKQVKTKVPPPPPPKLSSSKVNTVQQILARKLKKQGSVPQKPVSNIQIEQQPEPYQPQAPIKAQSISMPVDEQYQLEQEEIVTKHQQTQLPKLQTKAQFNLIEGIKAWCSESDEPFSNIFPPESRIVSVLYKKNETRPIKFTSKNPSFSPIVSKLIHQFVLKSKGELTQGQKIVLNELALEYFYSDLKCLTASFLILLVKLGKNYLKKYKQFFRTGLQTYCLDLLQHKEYFVQEQLTNFVQFLFEEIEVNEQDFYLLILLKITDNSTTKFANGQISDPKALLLMILACQHVYKTNKSVLGLYLQMASHLINEVTHQTNLLQSILKYFNKLETHQKYYQFQKQLKLKLINLISKGESSGKPRQQQTKNNEKKGENSGLMGFWNKAVDKLKNATTQLAQKQKTEPEEPQEDIRYDPVTKRYLVNGKAFEDEQGSKRDQNASKLPPTPPPPRPTKGGAPPPPPGPKKSRTVTAVNRYV